MRLDLEQQRWLARALGALAAGDARRYEDALWLGFGDAWVPVRRRLELGGLVRPAHNGGDPQMTERGVQTLRELQTRLGFEANGEAQGVA